jgi:hypothetical protein
MDNEFVILEIKYTNEYGEEFNTKRKVCPDWADMEEIEFLHDTYKSFLNTMGFPVDRDERIAIVGENEYIEEYCDGDCENCQENEDEEFYDADNFVDIIAEKVIEKVNNTTFRNKPIVFQ